MTKVGDTLYCYHSENENRMGRDGNPEKIFFEQIIVGETTTSWLVGNTYNPSKINKKTMLEKGVRGYGSYQWFTRDAMSDKKYWLDHARYISTIVGGQDACTLRKIADLIGYNETTKSIRK